MSYPLPWSYKTRPKPAPKTPPAPILPAGLAEEFRERPFGSYGETFALRAEPPPPPPKPFIIEPPPWVTGELDPIAPPAEPDKPLIPGQALADLKRQNNDVDEPRFSFGPPARSEPLERYRPPEWTQAEREAAHQAAIDRQREEAARRARIERMLAEQEEPT